MRVIGTMAGVLFLSWLVPQGVDAQESGELPLPAEVEVPGEASLPDASEDVVETNEDATQIVEPGMLAVGSSEEENSTSSIPEAELLATQEGAADDGSLAGLEEALNESLSELTGSADGDDVSPEPGATDPLDPEPVEPQDPTDPTQPEPDDGGIVEPVDPEPIEPVEPTDPGVAPDGGSSAAGEPPAEPEDPSVTITIGTDEPVDPASLTEPGQPGMVPIPEEQ